MIDQASFISTMIQNDGEYHYYYIIVPEEVVRSLSLKYRDRIIALFNEENHIHCALHRDPSDNAVIYLGKYAREKAGILPGEKVKVSIRKDDTEYGMEMPLELEEVLGTDSEGLTAFQKLTPGRKRTALYFISKAKMEETRIQRAILIVENIKNGFIHPNDMVRKHN